MLRLKRISVLVFLFLSLSAVSYYLFLLWGVKTDQIRTLLIQDLEDATDASLTSGSFHVSYFPALKPEIRGLALTFKGSSDLVSFRAENVSVRFRFFSFFFNEKNIRVIEIKNGEAVFNFPGGHFAKRFVFDHIKMKMTARRPGTFRVAFESNFQQTERSVSGKFSITGAAGLKKIKWESLGIAGDLAVRDFPVALLFNANASSLMRVKNGKINGSFSLHKKEGDNSLEIKGQSRLSQFRYEIQQKSASVSSPEIEAELGLETEWNPFQEEWHLKQATFKSPIGKFDFSGSFFTNGEMKNVRLNAFDLIWEAIPQYYIPFKEAIPFNVGFSGKSDLEMSFDGTLDHFMIHANWDLTESLLTYAGYFTKPKDLPTHLIFDFLVKKGEQLSGDFSLRLQDATLKGTLAHFDLKTQIGQMNVITNKFRLKGWEGLLPVFQNYALEGEIKILADLEGDLFLRNPQELKSMLNVTLENGQMVRKDGVGIRNIRLSLDYGVIALDCKELQFEAGPSQVFLKGLVYHPFQNPDTRIDILSPKLDLVALLETIGDLGKDWLPQEIEKKIMGTRDAFSSFLPRGEFLENLSARIESTDQHWLISALEFRAFDGNGKLKGEIHWDGVLPAYSMEGEINQLKLARFFSRGGVQEKKAEGNFFLTFNLQGRIREGEDWKNGLAGEGEFSITNGEFHTFDILGEVSKIHSFSPVKSSVTGTTPVHDLRSKFYIKDGKMMTEKMLLLSEEYSASADGEISLDGALNFRLDVYLGMPLAAPVLEPFVGKVEARENQQLGPIPFLLSGRLEAPELKPNPALLPRLQDNLTHKKTQKVLRNFLPESFLLKRPPTSS